MSASGPGDEGDDPSNPFAGMPFFGDLARMLQQQGPVSWDAARHLALSIATDGQPEANVDPLERMKLEQLARVADLQVSAATGLTTSQTGRAVSVLPVNRSGWAQRTLDAYRPLFEILAETLTAAPPPGVADDPTGDPADAWMGGLMQMLGPMMLGMTAGGMTGHLSRRALGQYELPLPRPPGDEIMVVVPNLDVFAAEWSLEPDDLRLWVCLHEVAHHTVFGVPHVRDRVDSLVRQYLRGFEPNADGFEGKLGEIDLGNPESLNAVQELFGDPEVVLGAIQSDAQRALLPHLSAIVAVVVGVVDHVMDQIGVGLMSSYGQLTEALRRRRVTSHPSDRFVERLFGLELSQADYDRGAAFVAGVIERAGPSGLDALWQQERALPTPAEVDAPGLWLARLEFPD